MNPVLIPYEDLVILASVLAGIANGGTSVDALDDETGAAIMRTAKKYKGFVSSQFVIVRR